MRFFPAVQTSRAFDFGSILAASGVAAVLWNIMRSQDGSHTLRGIIAADRR